jgi:hypothetical protein
MTTAVDSKIISKIESGKVIWDKFGNPQRIISVDTDLYNTAQLECIVEPCYGIALRCENLTKIIGDPIGFTKDHALVGQINLFESDFEKYND